MRPLHPSTCFSLPLLIQVLSTFIFSFFIFCVLQFYFIFIMFSILFLEILFKRCQLYKKKKTKNKKDFFNDFSIIF